MLVIYSTLLDVMTLTHTLYNFLSDVYLREIRGYVAKIARVPTHEIPTDEMVEVVVHSVRVEKPNERLHSTSNEVGQCQE